MVGCPEVTASLQARGVDVALSGSTICSSPPMGGSCRVLLYLDVHLLGLGALTQKAIGSLACQKKPCWWQVLWVGGYGTRAGVGL